jgi:hypothetical protein
MWVSFTLHNIHYAPIRDRFLPIICGPLSYLPWLMWHRSPTGVQLGEYVGSDMGRGVRSGHAAINRRLQQ